MVSNSCTCVLCFTGRLSGVKQTCGLPTIALWATETDSHVFMVSSKVLD